MSSKKQKLTHVDVDGPCPTEKVIVTSNFDSGSIEVIDIVEEMKDDKDSTITAINLKLKPEPFTEGTDKRAHMQWFHFCVSGAASRRCQYSIVNAKDASYAEAWTGYQVCYSHTLEEDSWRRCTETSYSSEGGLQWSFTSLHPKVYFAYFAPYSLERTQRLVGFAQINGAQVNTLGLSVEGRSIDLMKIGEGKRKVWIIARQHPGESMASWLIEGLVHSLLKPAEKMGSVRLDGDDGATFFIVPNINPDGSVRGHLRTNAKGANLNREWADTGDYKAPTITRSPEVFYTLEKMKMEGCDLFVDVHGDEEIPDNFFAGSQGIPTWTKRLEVLFLLFSGAMLDKSRFFQVGRGYGEGGPLYLCENDKAGDANLAIAGDHVGERFDCLSVTLEMPFKDVSGKDVCDSVTGWSPGRCKELGRDLAGAVSSILPYVRSATVVEDMKEKTGSIKETSTTRNNWWGAA